MGLQCKLKTLLINVLCYRDVNVKWLVEKVYIAFLYDEGEESEIRNLRNRSRSDVYCVCLVVRNLLTCRRRNSYTDTSFEKLNITITIIILQCHPRYLCMKNT